MLTERLRNVTHSNVKAMMYAFMIPSKIEIHQQHIPSEIPVAPLVERAEEFSLLNKMAHDSLIELIQEFEAWSIAFPEIELFQTALNSVNHDAQHASIALFNSLLTALPTDPAPDAPPNVPRPIPKPPLNPDQIGQLKMLVAEYKQAMDDIGSYVFDLQVEAQNKLLSGLFDHRVPRRKPLDPNLKVLSTEPVEMDRLMYYFMNETAWGKEYKQHEAEYTKPVPKG